ncbi:MAG: alpha/beta hydrolase [Chloroflexota bacterium]
MIPIWPDAPPGSESWTHEEVSYLDEADGGQRIRNVVVPSLTPFLPDPTVATGTAVIVAPGGGFRFLAWDYEGTQVAEWLAQRGVAAFVLKYRLTDTGPTPDSFREAMDELFSGWGDGNGGIKQVQRAGELGPVVPLSIADGAQAVRFVRERAEEWSLDPARIGFMGFSAGAFVAAGVAVHADPTARPSFVAPIYGGSLDGAIPLDAPPMFAVVAADDPICYDTTVRLAGEWRTAGQQVDLHVFARGSHGFGARKLGLPVDSWLDLFLDWVRSL